MLAISVDGGALSKEEAAFEPFSVPVPNFSAQCFDP